MSRRRHRSPSLIHCQATTTQILKQTNTIIFSKCHHFFISLILSFLLFSFQTSAQTIIHSLTSSVDNDAYIKTYFHQLRNPQNPLISDQDLDFRFFRNTQPKPQLNATTQMGFSGFISDNGIKVKKSPLIVGIPLFASYGLEYIGFIFTRSWAQVIIFVLIVNHFLKIDQSLIEVVRKGAYLGTTFIWFNEIRVVIRVVFTRFLAKLFFEDIKKDGYTSYKYFVKLMFMPYSQRLIWVEGFEEERIYGFLYSWFLLEMLVSCVCTVYAIVCMADRGKTDWEVIKKGFRLLSLRKRPAILLMSLEYIVWRFVSAMLTGIFGELFASFFQSFKEVYFMVAWIIYYFAVMSMEANSRGVRFGRRAELEAIFSN